MDEFHQALIVDTIDNIDVIYSLTVVKESRAAWTSSLPYPLLSQQETLSFCHTYWFILALRMKEDAILAFIIPSRIHSLFLLFPALYPYCSQVIHSLWTKR